MGKIFRKNRNSSLLVVLNEKFEVILVNKISHQTPKLRIPGGTEEEGESQLIAAKRETLEETGLEIGDDTKIHFLFSEWNEKWNHHYNVFGCIIPAFSGLHGGPVIDGNDVLEVEVRDVADAVYGTEMVPQHRKMLGMAAEKLSTLY